VTEGSTRGLRLAATRPFRIASLIVMRRRVAKIYHAAVRSQGQGAFRDGQMKWCPYPRGSIKCWVSITRRDG
jgi:hypothetical protein